jgi:hypothetical protein
MGLLAEWRLVTDRIANIMHNCAMFVIAAQVCVIYATSGLSKVQGSEWRDGTAVWYTLHLDYLRPFPALNELVASNSVAVLVLCYMTVFAQSMFAVCVFNRRLKNCLLVVLVAEHLGIAVLMGLPFFSLTMVVADSVFLPTSFLMLVAANAGHAGRRLRRSLPRRTSLLPPMRRRPLRHRLGS